jgi:hypothetical protein
MLLTSRRSAAALSRLFEHDFPVALGLEHGLFNFSKILDYEINFSMLADREEFRTDFSTVKSS